MEKRVSLAICILLVVISVCFSSIATAFFIRISENKEKAPEDIVIEEYPGTDNGTSEGDEKDLPLSEKLSSGLNEVKAYFDNLYIGDIDEEYLTDCVIEGFVAGTGDKYAYYYDKEGYDSLKNDLEGEMQGIGVSVIFNADYKAIEVINVFPDSPAMKAGVEIGDLIKFVLGEDDEEYRSVESLGYNVALNMLRGKAGTKAKFISYRGAGYEEEVAFEIERSYITEQSVTWRLYSLDKKIGIISISGFDSATVIQFEDALEALKNEGVEKLIFDVRNNPGGELNSICSILDTLVPEGPVIRTIDKTDKERTVYTSDENEIDMPMAVIVNSNTASAAELFTSTLRDYEKAVIVGVTTYGKGCMQTIYPLSNGGCLSLTTALYCPPFSDNYDGIGIVPDVECELSEEAQKKSIYKLTDEEDNQLTAAVKALEDKK